MHSSLEDKLASAGLHPLDTETLLKFETYLSLFVRWNARLNLSSVRDPEEIVERHLFESITVARALPDGLATLLDFGSGGGLPGIPIALCRPEISVTLAESQNKKAAFLQEAVRVLKINAKVHAGRAETLRSVFDCVTLRAVDKMPQAVAAAVNLVAPKGWLALMTTDAGLAELQTAAGPHIRWESPIHLPGSESRILALAPRGNR
ncbi:MAG TPA: 16S rRNA (guanine(527)-N(7))-methyltransferase RsmG [Terracidiphilus sp.]|jgi:16S rRNA (guanine527-N7)-methyltransferase